VIGDLEQLAVVEPQPVGGAAVDVDTAALLGAQGAAQMGQEDTGWLRGSPAD